MSETAERLVRNEICEQGAISFARFMELSLYAPGAGYYEKADGQTGRLGDFYTSVSVGPVLGFLLAAWLDRVGRGFATLDWMEAGAHDGRLTEDVLGALERFYPGTLGRVRCRLIEPSATRREWQRCRLARWSDRVAWVESWEALGRSVHGVIFSNELLDAMPFHRLRWDAAGRRWFECGVTVRDGALAWCDLEPGLGMGLEEYAPLEGVLPEGYVVERCPAAVAWWSAAASRLERGWLVTLDYGFDEDGWIRPERIRGTARAYWRHRVSDDLLARPGEQDLTAHVDFPRLMAVGEEAGLETEALLVQGRWLGRIATQVMEAGGEAAAWLTERARGLLTLTHPAHLGHSLRALVQRRPGGEGAGGEG